MKSPIRRALISVFHKEGLAPIVERLQAHGVEILSTGGTQRAIEAMGAEVTPVESVTQTAEMLGGRVKTLHPMVFGGILARRNFEADDVDVALVVLLQVLEDTQLALEGFDVVGAESLASR